MKLCLVRFYLIEGQRTRAGLTQEILKSTNRNLQTAFTVSFVCPPATIPSITVAHGRALSRLVHIKDPKKGLDEDFLRKRLVVGQESFQAGNAEALCLSRAWAREQMAH